MSKLKIPNKYKNLDSSTIENMKVKVVWVENGGLSVTIYDTLKQFLLLHNIEDWCGPFSDRIGDQPCLRFESAAAADILSR